MDKPHLSITQLNMLSFCGEQYRRRYINKEKIPPGISLLVGKSVDNTVNENLTHKIQNESLLSIEAVKDFARDAFNNEWDKGEIALDNDEIAKGIKKIKGEATDKTIRLSILHAEEIAPQLEPTHIQRKWIIELGGYPYDLIGFIDVQEGEKAIRDTKTASKSPAKNAADVSDQLTIYAMASMAIDKKLPGKLTLDYLVDNNKPKSIILETIRTIDDFDPILKRIEKAIEIIDKGIFMPARQDHFLCSPKFCGFYASCPYVRQSIYPMGG